jgi:hypothetical protein
MMVQHPLRRNSRDISVPNIFTSRGSSLVPCAYGHAVILIAIATMHVSRFLDESELGPPVASTGATPAITLFWAPEHERVAEPGIFGNGGLLGPAERGLSISWRWRSLHWLIKTVNCSAALDISHEPGSREAGSCSPGCPRGCRGVTLCWVESSQRGLSGHWWIRR